MVNCFLSTHLIKPFFFVFCFFFFFGGGGGVPLFFFLPFFFFFFFFFCVGGGGGVPPYVLSVVSFPPKDVLLTAQCICLAELLYLMAGQGTPT